MPTLTVETVRVDDVTFVELVIDADRSHRICLETRFDGPVWPPRTNGTVVDGWSDDGVTMNVREGKTAVGFATPNAISGRAVELVRAEPITDGPPDGVEAWIARMETRVETAERLDTIDDLSTAIGVVESVGGLSAVETLTAEITRDRRLANSVSTVPDDLRERLEAVDIPATTLARIAQTDSL